MIRVKEYLIPLRFSTLILQLVFTYSALMFDIENNKNEDNDKHKKNLILGFCIVMLIWEVFQMAFLFYGKTIFVNKETIIRKYINY